MRDGVKTPVVIGVTGHRDLRGQDKEKLRAAVRGELEALHSKCPHSPLLLLTGLAEGAEKITAAHVDVLSAIMLHNSLFKFAVAFYKEDDDKRKPELKAELHPLAYMRKLIKKYDGLRIYRL